MKALTLTLAILALLGSAASGFFYYQIGNSKVVLQNQLSAEKSTSAGLRADLEKTTGERDGLQTRLTATDGELGDTKSKLTASEARSVQLNRDLTQYKAMAAKSEAETQKLNADLASMRRELVQARLDAQFGSPEEIEKYKQSIAVLESKLAALQPGVSSSGFASAAGKPESGGPTSGTARVAVVGPKNAFLVLDLGAGSGIANGQKFLIARNGLLLADAIVSDVKDTYAIAQVTPASIKGNLAAGDVASYQK
jgi:septal ring factor EnvC (AmiA/AmiB activator)